MKDIKQPELPEPRKYAELDYEWTPLYAADQMHAHAAAHGEACYAAGVEEGLQAQLNAKGTAVNSTYLLDRIIEKLNAAVKWSYEKNGAANTPDGLLEDAAEFALSLKKSLAQPAREPAHTFVYQVFAYGETDFPEVTFATSIGNARMEIAKLMFGFPSPSDFDEVSVMCEDLEENIESDGIWSVTFEIGGIEVRKVFLRDPEWWTQPTPNHQEPIDMILHCPSCGKQHIDAPEGGPESQPDGTVHTECAWENPPHRSHFCHGCGNIWRPADVPTNGVEHIKTSGTNDNRRFSRNAVAAKPSLQEPINGIAATMFHDEGAISRCSCGRYSIDPKTLSDRQPVCECGKQHNWSGSFVKPGPDAKWNGAAPASEVEK